MFDTLIIALRLQASYDLNGIQYFFRRIPLIKKLFYGVSYEAPVLKIIFGVFAFVWEFFKKILIQFLYLFLVTGIITGVMLSENCSEAKAAAVVFQTFLILTVIGGSQNNPLFATANSDYYAICLLRMDAKKYALSQYIFYLICNVFGFVLAFLTIGHFIGNLSFLDALLCPLFVLFVKLSASGISLMGDMSKAKIYDWVGIIISTILLVVAIALPIANIILPVFVLRIIICVAVIPALFGVYKLCTYDKYHYAYRLRILSYRQQISGAKKADSMQLEARRKSLDDSMNASSNRKGFAFMHELFIKRHVKVLWRPAVIISCISAAVLFGASLLLVIFPFIRDSFHHTVLSLLPAMVFVMYFVNRGLPFTQALYVNCDHSMLTFSFYRQPKAILKLFVLRLISIVKINLLPAVVIGVGLGVLQFALTTKLIWVDCVVLFISTVALSIFFSVHYMVIYYLLQPYNIATEVKSPAYSFVKWLTYFVSYMIMIQVKVSSVTFGIGTIVFCVLYCLLACVLVYFKAPKTFHIKN